MDSIKRFQKETNETLVFVNKMNNLDKNKSCNKENKVEIHRYKDKEKSAFTSKIENDY